MSLWCVCINVCTCHSLIILCREQLLVMKHSPSSVQCMRWYCMFKLKATLCTMIVVIFRSPVRQSRPNKACLKCPSVHAYVRLSTKRFFNFNEIWRVCRGRWVMHDDMQYDPIQGQGHEPFKVGKPAFFRSYLLHHLQWELATDHRLLN